MIISVTSKIVSTRKECLLWIKRICDRLEKHRIKHTDSPVTKTELTALRPGTTSEVNLGFNPSGA